MNSYYDPTTGKQHRVRRGPMEAQKSIDRYNALSEQIERLEERLEDAKKKRDQARRRAFAALPVDDSYGITMGERFELVHFPDR